jgi:Tfp pilus assembly protein PilV
MMNLSPSRGFSLVEVIVSVLFLMIAISGLMSTYNYTSLQLERMRWKRSALHITQQKIEEFMANPGNGYPANANIDVPVTSSSYPIKSTLEVKQDPVDPNIIEWKIKWPEKNISVSLTIVR